MDCGRDGRGSESEKREGTISPSRSLYLRARAYLASLSYAIVYSSLGTLSVTPLSEESTFCAPLAKWHAGNKVLG